jgi:hypothetical protein
MVEEQYDKISQKTVAQLNEHDENDGIEYDKLFELILLFVVS